VCVDYADKNKACPKDAYPLPNNENVVDNLSGYKLLFFMHAYSEYNQIPMYHDNKDKTAFMIDNANYTYNVMPFGLKNARETCHRMVNTIFREEICDALEIYMDEIIVKSGQECNTLNPESNNHTDKSYINRV
jgi:hypothetical protein